MAKRSGIFENAPVFQLAMLVLLSSFVVIALAAYYNDYAPAFNNNFAYQALNRAATVSNANFFDPGFNAPVKKEMSGLLFTYLVAVFYKFAGESSIVLLICILNVVALFFSVLAFYKIADKMLGTDYAFLSSAVFALSAPVLLASLSGSDVSLNMLLLSFNIYFCYFAAEEGRYSGAFITAGLMLLSGYFGLVFGAVSVIYLLIKINSKVIQKNYDALIWPVTAIGLLCAGLFVFVFLDKFNPDAFNSGALFNTETFYVDTFFKDGFLWSKLFPPFFTLFFYFAIFMKLASDIKEKKIGINLFFGILTLVSLLAEFFATFAGETNPIYFLSPFYFVLVLLACKGIIQLSVLLGKNNGVLAKNVALAAIVFIMIYNGVLAFNMNIDQDRNIKSILSESYAEKFSGRH